tara:strand:+ start:395 stop:589 length:195 start_codon:yes stop_codon:yes gene_type:complete
MPVVEIHIKDNEVQKIEGNGAYVYVHDHDINKTTTMIFRKQEQVYDSLTHTRRSNNETLLSEEE